MAVWNSSKFWSFILKAEIQIIKFEIQIIEVEIDKLIKIRLH